MDFDYGVMPAIILVVGILIIWLCARRIVSLSTKTYARGWKVAQRILLSMVVLVTAAVAGSSLYNAIVLHHFWALHPHPGVIVDAGGYKMHIDCRGSGSPTIILETGLGSDSLIWGRSTATTFKNDPRLLLRPRWVRLERCASGPA